MHRLLFAMYITSLVLLYNQLHLIAIYGRWNHALLAIANHMLLPSGHIIWITAVFTIASLSYDWFTKHLDFNLQYATLNIWVCIHRNCWVELKDLFIEKFLFFLSECYFAKKWYSIGQTFKPRLNPFGLMPCMNCTCRKVRSLLSICTEKPEIL